MDQSAAPAAKPPAGGAEAEKQQPPSPAERAEPAAAVSREQPAADGGGGSAAAASDDGGERHRKRRAVLTALAEALTARSLHEDAAVAHLAAGSVPEALESYRSGGCYQMALALAGVHLRLPRASQHKGTPAPAGGAAPLHGEAL